MSNADETLPPRRRVDDERIDNIEQKLAAFEKMLAENTATTTEVRDILITARTIGKFATWGGGIIFAVAGAWAALRELGVLGGIHP